MFLFFQFLSANSYKLSPVTVQIKIDHNIKLMGSCSSSQKIDDFMHKCMFLPPTKINPKMISMVNLDPYANLCQIKNGELIISYLQIHKQNNNQKKWLVFSHGNAATIFDYYYYAKQLNNELNVGCVFYDYPGYGFSTGYPTEESCIDTLELVVNHLVTKIQIPKNDIILIGQSIGTGVIVSYAHKHQWTSPIVLISPYKTILSVVLDTSATSLTQYIDKFMSLPKIKDLNCPIKIFHGTNDNIVPISHGKALAAACTNKTFDPVWLPGVGHKDILEHIDMEDLFEVVNYHN